MASYFPDQESLVTVLRYRVVIEEIVVSAKDFFEFNKQAEEGEAGSEQSVEDILETKTNKFEDWDWGCVGAMADPSKFVGDWGEGYVAFKGDVTSASDDIVPCKHESWSHTCYDPIPFACNDYYKLLGFDDDHPPDPKIVEAMGHCHNLTEN
tara:strand:+ start:66 stop:521 length:456 start_codon:yes stop_codon:yes gene_type:complete